MGSHKSLWNFLYVVTVLCFSSGCISSTTDYRLSIPAESEKYEVFYWGITQIENDQFQAFIRPANKIQTGYGTTFLLVIPTNTKITDGQFPFIDSQYYHDAAVEHRQPEEFVIELYLNPKSESLSFNPAACTLSIDGKVNKASQYYVVRGDVSEFPIVKGNLQRPRPGERNLFRGEDLRKALESPFVDNVAYEIERGTGFVVGFDYPAPVPGKDVFTFTVNGVVSNGNAIPPININYNQSREIVRDFDLP